MRLVSPPIRALPCATAIALAAALATAPGCSRPEEPAAPAVPPNLVLISIDSLGAAHLPVYGYGVDTAPAITRLARESVVLDGARSTTTWTLPSHLSMLTSLYPGQHGVRASKKSLNPGVLLLSEVLERAQYRNEAVVSGKFLDRRYGYDRGWQRWDDELVHLSNTAKDVTSEQVHQRAIAALDRLAPGPFFLFLHYYDVHFDYRPPAPYDTMFDPGYSGEVSGTDFATRYLKRNEVPDRDLAHLVALYDGEIRWVDEWLGRLFDELRRRGLWDNTLVVFTADHGEEFLEHRHFGHNNNLFDETLHVPLILKLPAARAAGTRISGPFSLVDIAPTALAVAGLPQPSMWAGRDLTPVIAGEPLDRQEVFADLWGSLHAVVTGSHKALFRQHRRRFQGKARLFDLIADPRETRNVATENPDLVRRLRRRMTQTERDFQEFSAQLKAGDVPDDPEFEAGLRALGYL